MAREEGDSVGTAIPVRSADQVGVLTNAFNVLVDRFAAAEHAYRQDLAGALAYDRDRSAFLAALSHELRTPLNAILGFTEVLLAEVDGPLSAEARENLMVVRTSGEHLRSLIGDILDLVGAGIRRAPAQPPPRGRVRHRGRSRARSALTAQEKPIEVKLDGGSATAWADPRRIRQILGNVIGNAIKFTSEGYVSVHVAGPRPLRRGRACRTADRASRRKSRRRSSRSTARRATSARGAWAPGSAWRSRAAWCRCTADSSKFRATSAVARASRSSFRRSRREARSRRRAEAHPAAGALAARGSGGRRMIAAAARLTRGVLSWQLAFSVTTALLVGLLAPAAALAQRPGDLAGNGRAAASRSSAAARVRSAIRRG